MLEKLAELVREQGIIESSLYNEEEKRVYVYTTIPLESPVTINADVSNPVSAEYKLARWAVLLVAKGLEKEVKEASDLDIMDDGKVHLAIKLLDLIAEAKEGANESSDL